MKKITIFSFVLAIVTFSNVFTTTVQAQGDKKSTAILEAMSNKYQKVKSFKAVFTYTQEVGKPLKVDSNVKGNKFRLKMAGHEIFND